MRKSKLSYNIFFLRHQAKTKTAGTGQESTGRDGLVSVLQGRASTGPLSGCKGEPCALSTDEERRREEQNVSCHNVSVRAC